MTTKLSRDEADERYAATLEDMPDDGCDCAACNDPGDFGYTPPCTGTSSYDGEAAGDTSRTIVQATRIIGTDRIVYSAWESSSYTGEHATVTTIDGEVFGKIGTRRPTNLPASPIERMDASYDHYAAEYARAVDTILAHEPRLHTTGTIDGCEITEDAR
jgi:hypothetical protein